MYLYHGTSDRNGQKIIRSQTISGNYRGKRFGIYKEKAVFLTPFLGIAIRYGTQKQLLDCFTNQVSNNYKKNSGMPFYIFRIWILPDELLPDIEEKNDNSAFMNYPREAFNSNQSMERLGTCMLKRKITIKDHNRMYKIHKRYQIP